MAQAGGVAGGSVASSSRVIEGERDDLMLGATAKGFSDGSALTAAGQALQASATAARGSVSQAQNMQSRVAMSTTRPPPLEAGAAVVGPPPGPPQNRGPDGPPPAPRMSDVRGGEEIGGIPSMAITSRYLRAWSIQEALDQHAALCRQKDILAKVGTNRVQARRTQLRVTKLEVEEAVERTKCMSPADAADGSKTQALAAHLRRTCRDFSMSQRLCSVDEQVVQRHLDAAEEEIEFSREEMKVMKQAIDDKGLAVATDDVPPPAKEEPRLHYCTNCKVGGHGQRFCEYLLKRPDWHVYPSQKWFEDEKRNEYHCPLGKRLVDFADESHFSRLAMYLKGRIWLEDKTKMWQLVPDLMPATYVIKDLKWEDDHAPVDQDGDDLPWFVKEADRNWGTSVVCCAKASECMSLAKPASTYVVQQHIRDPLLMDDGRKVHIKFYVLLFGLEDAITWNLYTFKDGYLSISPNKWTASDLSKDTQVTIIRSERIAAWAPWPEAYPKCKASVAEVVKRAVQQGKLEGRVGKRQFEILSSDFVVDMHGNVWLLEFNMSPVLKDEKDSPLVHDSDMITNALDIVVPWAESCSGNWDFAGEFVGAPPLPKPPPTENATREQTTGSATGEQTAGSSTSEQCASGSTEAQGAPAPAS